MISAFIFAVVTATTPLPAAEPWTAIDAALAPVAIDVTAIDAAAGVTGTTPAGEPRNLPMADLVSLARGHAAPLASGLFVLHTAAGERIVGSPVGSTAESITWANESLADRTVPLSQVVRIDRSLEAPQQAEADLTEDVATLANGDVVRGVVSAVDGKSLTLTVGDNEVPIALANLAAVRFAATAPQANAATPPFALTLADGSVVFTTSINGSSGDGGWTVQLGDDDARVSLPADKLVRVDHLAGPVRWLSTLTPQETQYTPYLGETYPPRTDASVTGGPITFGDRTYDRGIGMHARTSMTFALDGTYQTFRTRYAAEAGTTLTDAIVRVLVDGKPVHDQPLRSGVLSPIVEADLRGAKTLTLQVDFGAGLHTQDRVNWIEPALLKKPLASPATTQPQ